MNLRSRAAPLAPSSLSQKVVGNNNHLQAVRDDHYDGEMKKAASSSSFLISVDRSAAKPLYSQIYDAFRAAIVGRNLRAGEQSPPLELSPWSWE